MATSIPCQLKANGHASTLPQQLRFQQTERHGDQHEAKQQIGTACKQLNFGSAERVLWHQIAESDGGQCDETKVGTVNDTPVFPQRKDDRANADVCDEYAQYDSDWHLGTVLMAGRADGRQTDRIVDIIVRIIIVVLVGVVVLVVLMGNGSGGRRQVRWLSFAVQATIVYWCVGCGAAGFFRFY